jgi:hypothetical protein
MYDIKFSNQYKKMPSGIQYLETFVSSVRITEYSKLTPEEIKEDTETIQGTFFDLPQGSLIEINLWTAGFQAHAWKTYRRYSPEKYDFYKSLVGEQVGIKIERK